MSTSSAIFRTGQWGPQLGRAEIVKRLRHFLRNAKAPQQNNMGLIDAFLDEKRKPIAKPSGTPQPFVKPDPVDEIYLVDESEEDGIVRIQFSDGSWIVLFRERHEILIHPTPDGRSQDAAYFAHEFTTAMAWTHGRKNNDPNIRYGEPADESGPLVINMRSLYKDDNIVTFTPTGRRPHSKKAPLTPLDENGQTYELRPKKEKIKFAKALPFLTSLGIGIGVKFGLAATLTTSPAWASGIIATAGVIGLGASPFLVPIVTAVALGAAAGIIATPIVTYFWDNKKKEDRLWLLKSMGWRALAGGLGGAFGYGLADLFDPNGLAQGFYHNHFGSSAQVTLPAHDAAVGTLSANPAPTSTETLSGGAVDMTPTPPPVPPSPPMALPTPDPAPVPPPLTPVDVPPAPPVHSVAPILTSTTTPPAWVDKLMSPQLFSQLPAAIQQEAVTDPLKFCTDAPMHLISFMHHSPAALHAGALVNQHGLNLAAHEHVHGPVARILNANEAYIKGNGIGTSKDIPLARVFAQRAGHAAHNYGMQFLRLHPAPA